MVSGHAQRLNPRVAFLFTGQGAQYIDMGRALYETEPVFRAVVDRCAAVFQQQTGESLLAVLYPQDASQPSKIDHTAYTQPALFAIEYALAELWRARGIHADAVLGHSIGEYAAACLAGVFSLEDGMKLVTARGRLMGSLPQGGVMATIFAPAQQVQDAIQNAGLVSIAAVNAPDSTVISGAAADVQAIVEQFKAAGVQSRPLVVSHAFHSTLMEPILDEFERVASTCQFHAPKIPLISNISGQPFPQGQIPDAAYWRKHIRSAVQFAPGIQTLHSQGFDLFLEVGPSPVLINLGKRCLPEESGHWAASLRQGQPEALTLRKALGTLYTRGVKVDWDLVEGPRQRAPISLPTYPFQHERYWFKTVNARPRREQPEQPLLGNRLRSPGLQASVFETQVDAGSLSYLWDHRAYANALFPAAGYIEMMLSAAAALKPGSRAVLEDVTIQDTLVLPAEDAVILQAVLTPQPGGSTQIKIYSTRGSAADAAEWQLHAYANIPATAAPSADASGLDAARALCAEQVEVSGYYQTLAQMGMDYGPAFQNIHELWRGAGQALARVELAESLPANGYSLHPALLDACLQTVAAAFPASAETYLPIGFDRVSLFAQPGRELWSVARVQPGENAETFRADLAIYAPDGQLVGQIDGMRIKHTSAATLQRLVQRAAGRPAFADWLYRMEWHPQPLAEQPAPAALPASWLIVADGELGTALAGLLPNAVLATTADTLAQDGPQRWSIRAGQPGDFHQLLESTQPGGVVCLTASTQATLHVLQAACAMPSLPQVWLATLGAQPVNALDGGSEDVQVAPAALWGLARSTRLEYPDLHLHSVDLDPASLVESNTRSLWQEIQAQPGEDEVAYRNEQRYAHQLVHLAAAPTHLQPVRLEITTRGELDNLALRPMQRSPLAAGAVEIAVRATGLNFRDVLNTLGMYPGDAGALGHECSGVVTAVGADVTHLYPGDRVLALASDCFATYAVARQEFVVRKPADMSFEQAATIPIAFLTADYALNSLGRMRPGERVLIHAAAGGVGLAAVQLAQLAGAEIYATAGSPAKREMLTELGVQHVLDSRSLDFADEILRLTQGEGVQLVLNSLADAFIPKSLDVLALGGRFLEIGKRGIWSHAQVQALGKAIDYHIIYLGEVCERQPALVGALFRDLMTRFETGALRPLPWRAFPLARASEAFRFMAKARHTGKIVLTQPALPAPAPLIRKDATYLITGGLGGLGLAAARQLAQSGAGQIALVGRRAPTPETQQSLRALETATGTQIITLQADITRREEVERVLDSIRRGSLPLAGVIHAAGALDDGILAQQTWERFAQVIAPKLDAAWVLHQCTAGVPLDFFVLFSAGAGWLGSPGQSGYAAANTALDALAYYRRARGLPALSIAWGPWSEVGMAALLSSADQERMRRQGLGSISPSEGTQILESLLGSAGALAVLPVDWALFAGAHSPLPARFVALANQAQSNTAGGGKPAAPAIDIRKRLSDAPLSKRRALLQAHLREHAMRVLGLSASFNLDARQPLREMGMDSLMAVELRNAISASLQQKLPSTLLFDFPTIEALTDTLTGQLWPETPATPPPATVEQSKPDNAVENLSDEEAEALLLAELEKPKRK
jgi:myxalamid-type polyketide synthase MxaB